MHTNVKKKQYLVNFIREAIREDARVSAPFSLMGFGNNSQGKDGVAGNLRNGIAVNKTTGGIADLEDTRQGATQAACCLITAADGKVLAVSRKDDPSAWGLVGGKVDPGETPEEAAARECEEECGLTPVKLSKVFSMTDEQGFLTTTFATEVTGEIGSDEAGVIRWVHPSVLMNDEHSPFAAYNRALFKKLGVV